MEKTRAGTPAPPAALICDVSALIHPDLPVIDALARLRLAVRRHGLELRLHGADEHLRGLLALTGLAGVLPVEPLRQPEQREQRVGVEEVGEPGDAPS
ncbi:STAS domain-containing protein [Kitasatospora sp. NPDC004240]